MSKNTALADRQQYVVKSNDLIRYSRFSLTAQQQKILLFAISKIRPLDTSDTWYTFTVSDICRACGVDIDSGGMYYRTMKDDMKMLRDTSYWIMGTDGVERLISWLDRVELTPNSGQIRIKFNDMMQPYLFELKERYTQYRLETILVFSSVYSIRLYEILRSHTTQTKLDYGIEVNADYKVEHLKKMLDIAGSTQGRKSKKDSKPERYATWNDFHRYVLKKAVDEINTYCDDMHVEYELLRTGKTVTAINFIINGATPQQIVQAQAAKREKLTRKKPVHRKPKVEPQIKGQQSFL